MPEPFPNTSLAKKSGKSAPHERSVHLATLDELQQRIRQGAWLPGERLPSIRQLAQEYHAGTGSIREALRSLQSLGLVKILHGSGVYVTGARPATEISSHFQKAGDNLYLALAETRRILEPELAALAAERGTDQELLELEKLVQRMEQESQSGEDFAELDVAFHRQIALAARNPILYQAMEGISELFLQSRRALLLDSSTLLRALRFHTLIAEALCARNAAQARLLMQGHMNSLMDEILAFEASQETGITPDQTPKETL